MDIKKIQKEIDKLDRTKSFGVSPIVDKSMMDLYLMDNTAVITYREWLESKKKKALLLERKEKIKEISKKK